MIRRTMVVLALAASALTGVRANVQQSVDDVIAKNLQAKGGLEKMRTVQTLKQTCHVSIAGGIEGTLTIYGKRPNLTRQEVTLGAFGQMVSAFDGTTAWSINPMAGMTTPTALSGPQADAQKQQADFDGPLVDYKAKGYTAELVGTEPVGDRRAYHVRLTGKDQRVLDWYLDAETGLEVKVASEADTPVGKAQLEQVFADFRDVQGLKLPFSIRTLANGVEQVKIDVEKVEINAKFDDSVFRMPKGQ